MAEYYYSDDNEEVIGTSGDDYFWYDFEYGGNDTLIGGDGDDLFQISGIPYRAEGGNGSDVFSCYWDLGAHTLIGGAGDDLYEVAAGSSAVIQEAAGGGTDTVELHLRDGEPARNGIYTFQMPDYVENLLVDTDFHGSLSVKGNALDNHIVYQTETPFASWTIKLYGYGGNDTIEGAALAEKLDGGDGNDYVSGGGGNDSLYGGSGDDILAGDAGDDVVGGSNGNDTLYGGAGNDSVLGGADNDELWGGDGNDTLLASSGNDRLYGDAGADSVAGEVGDDRLYGGAGDDTLQGGTGADWLYGDQDDDLLSGDADNDRLYGGDGNDTLQGGAGDDRLVGGYDADHFLFTTTATANSVVEHDTIVDYNAGEGDVVDLPDGAASVSSSVETTGGLVLTLVGDGDTVVLEGVDHLSDVVFI